MKLNVRKLAIAVILIALAAGSWWLSRLTTAPEIVTDSKQRHDPDYIVENFHTTVMTSQGRPQVELSGRRLVHYGDDGSSTIEEPYLIQYTPGQAPTHARAKQGYLPKDVDFVRLIGDVNVAHGRDPRGAGGDVRTQELIVQLDKSKGKGAAP